MFETAALLIIALLFGGMVLYSFGFAAFVFSALPADVASLAIRRAFPHFYLFVIVSAGLAAVVLLPIDRLSVALMGAIALTTLPVRQVLMPAINDASDKGQKRRFQVLHGLSVATTLAHILLAGIALARFV